MTRYEPIHKFDKIAIIAKNQQKRNLEMTRYEPIHSFI